MCSNTRNRWLFGSSCWQVYEGNIQLSFRVESYKSNKAFWTPALCTCSTISRSLCILYFPEMKFEILWGFSSSLKGPNVPVDFCLWPATTDQGITWVVLVLVLVPHLVHSLLKMNLSEKISPFLGIVSGSSCSTAKHSINWAMVTLIQIVYST